MAHRAQIADGGALAGDLLASFCEHDKCFLGK
jgi:hypothetical protein